MRLVVSAGYLDTRPRKSSIHGTAEVASITLVDPVLRSYTRNLVLSASIDGINSDNAVLGSLLSSERSRTVRLAAAYSDAKPKRVLLAGITIRGLDILGAKVERPMAVTDFNKVNARASSIRRSANAWWLGCGSAVSGAAMRFPQQSASRSEEKNSGGHSKPRSSAGTAAPPDRWSLPTGPSLRANSQAAKCTASSMAPRWAMKREAFSEGAFSI
jgi:hypothetical protein